MKKTKLIALLVISVLIFAIVMPTMKVLANSDYVITFQTTGTHTLQNVDGHLKIDGEYVDLRDSNDVTIGVVEVNGTTASITVTNGEAGELNYFAANKFTLFNTNGHVAYNNGTKLSTNQVFMVEDYENNNPPAPSTLDDIDVAFTFVGTTGEVLINGKRAGGETNSWSGTVENAGYTDVNEKNEIKISTSFGEPKFSKITINGVDYTFTDDSDMHTIEVAGAGAYTINATADNSLSQDRTIIWANTDVNKNADNYDPDMVLEHGAAKVVAIYDENGHKVGGETTVDKDGMGYVVVKPKHKVVFEFVPEYGYQLTSVKANGFALEPQNTTNQYTFIMPDTNVHFAAEFAKTDDVVKANSDKVTGGTIELGDKLEGGSVQLSVSNVELSADKIKGFENAAEGYTVSNYLDIDLYNVFYKGKDDDEDVWSNKIDELDKEAVITLKLADGLTANDIVIVHNIHDGEEYEIIQIDSYDPATNTITFRTKSFSNYAIATKTTKTEEEEKTTKTSSNPTTGDNIIIVISIFAISTLGLFTTLKLNKSQKAKKQ